MVKNDQDALVRAYAKLLSLRKNIGGMTDYNVPEVYVPKFHAVLDRLEGIGMEVAEYRIPDSEVQPKVIGPRTKRSGGAEIVHYSKEKYVDKSFILTELDAILGYLESITSGKPPKIGYRTPESE